MNEKNALEVTAVRAIETSDRGRTLWSDADRAWASRAAAEVVGEGASVDAFVARRAKLALEIASLRAVPVPDLADVLVRIGRLEDQVPTLPVIGMPVSQGRRADARQEAPGALERAWQRIKQAAGDLVSLRRIEPATARLVIQEEDSLRRQHLELLLFSARIAAMRPDRAAYAQSLRASSAWIEQYFDTARPEVAGALAEIQALAEVNIDPELPGIGEAARLLQSIIRASAPTP